MIPISQKQFLRELIEFSGSDIILEFKDGLEGKIKLKKAEITYNSENSFIEIKNNDNNIKINTTLIYGYIKNEKNNELEVKVESELELKIQNI